MTEKYSNGMYKDISKKQDETSQKLFNAFSSHFPVSMGCNLIQKTGNAYFHYYKTINNIEETILIICLDRRGNILY